MIPQKIVWLDRTGYPVEFIQGRPCMNLLRWLFLCSIRRSLCERGRWQRAKGGGLVDTYCRFDEAIGNRSSK